MNEEGRSLAVRRRERLAPDLRELLLKQTQLSQEVPRKPLAWPSERASGGVSRLRFAARSFLCLVAILPFMIVGMGAQALILRFWRNAAGTLPRAFLWWVGKVLGLRVIVKGEIARAAPVLVVSNHVSWIDIIVLGGLVPLSFVAKSEVAGWPIIGTLARLQRSIFVDRTRRTMTADIARSIGHRLVAGDTIVLFGEGTTGDGNRVLPFRPALLASVREAMSASGAGGAPILVQPLSIVYSGLDGLPLGRADRPSVAWYGDMSLGSHLLRLLAIGPIDVTLCFGNAFEVAHGDRKVLANRLGHAVREMAAQTTNGRPHPSAVHETGS
ncbi:MAG: 1-acyl-sn-glycerol-3-phosphate acyltransferase [Hyphomicrobiales bacterium]|nr:1-acyl-sn-glycerol-3-phosphate acyltransferase [Hyphomicrobiales bacterium]MBV9431293.1 1-acyl-sn-glycerol-3-phosphate acyltransferase [Hyphomicrobiales bacterium]MBV9741380.1 1-acyl-sn-glycerol-3-phosphate acyltransferase [Hyphomicrobiales bacterium]